MCIIAQHDLVLQIGSHIFQCAHFNFICSVLVILQRRLDRSTAMSATSGVRPAAILVGNVITSTSPSTEGSTAPPRWCPSRDHDTAGGPTAKNTVIKLIL